MVGFGFIYFLLGFSQISFGKDLSEIYYAEKDTRKCASPMCGGYFISSVNRKKTECHDLTLQPSCYVSEISGFAESRGIVQGTLQLRSNFGYLVARNAWTAYEHPHDNLYSLEDTGVRCIRAPCFSIRLHLANHPNTPPTMLSSVSDKSERGSKIDLFSAGSKFSLVSGYTFTFEDELIFTVTGVYQCSTLSMCSTDSDCTATPYHSSVTSREECYCLLCSSYVMSQSIALLNEKSWSVHCLMGDPNCPVVRCMAPPDAVCSKSGECIAKKQ
jgi:hypothetical protein